MLDASGDLITAEETIGVDTYQTIGVSVGAPQVSQAMSLNVSTKVRDIWFNRSAGVDFNGLFYDSTRADAVMNPIRAQAFRDALTNTPGFGSFADGRDVNFTRTSRKIEVKLPCVVIACDASRVTPSVIG